MLNSSGESQEPIFKNGIKAGAAAEPNSNAEPSKGSICKSKYKLNKKIKIVENNIIPFLEQFHEATALLELEASGRMYPSQHCLSN